MFDTQSPFLPSGKLDTVAIADEKLRHAIVSGAFAPGERLSEVEICREYGLGRGVVRAALASLAHAGFVSSQPRSGWKVAPITAVGLREVILGRRQLEPLLGDVELSAAEFRRLETLCDMLAALLAAIGTAGSEEQISLARRYDRHIRDLLALHLKAPLLGGWLANLWDKSDRYIGFLEKRGSARLLPVDWSAFVEAKRSGRVAAASEWLNHSCEAFAAFVQSRFLESDAALIELPSRKRRRRTATELAAAILPIQPNPKQTS